MKNQNRRRLFLKPAWRGTLTFQDNSFDMDIELTDLSEGGAGLLACNVPIEKLNELIRNVETVLDLRVDTTVAGSSVLLRQGFVMSVSRMRTHESSQPNYFDIQCGGRFIDKPCWDTTLPVILLRNGLASRMVISEDGVAEIHGSLDEVSLLEHVKEIRYLGESIKEIDTSAMVNTPVELKKTLENLLMRHHEVSI